LSKVRKVDFSPDEFLVGVAGMRPFDIGVYWVTVSLIYSSGGPIEADDPRLFRMLKAKVTDIAAALYRLETASKLHRNGSQIDNKRARKEIESAVKRISNARENGMKGGRHSSKINGIKNQAGYSVGLPAEKLSLTTTTHHTPPLNPLDPPKGEKSKPEKKNATSISQDWTPTEQDYNHAAAKGLDLTTIAAVANQFRDHHLSKGSRFKNWGAAWRTWVGNHLHFHGTATWPANGARQPGRNNGTADALSSYVRKYIIGEPLSEGPGVQGTGRDGFDPDASRGRLGNGQGHTGPIIDADEFERVPEAARQT